MKHFNNIEPYESNYYDYIYFTQSHKIYGIFYDCGFICRDKLDYQDLKSMINNKKVCDSDVVWLLKQYYKITTLDDALFLLSFCSSTDAAQDVYNVCPLQIQEQLKNIVLEYIEDDIFVGDDFENKCSLESLYHHFRDCNYDNLSWQMALAKSVFDDDVEKLFDDIRN